MNKKKSISKIILLVFSIGFVVLFFGILALSILLTIFCANVNACTDCLIDLTPFFKWLSNFSSMGDPFAIFIEILSSVGGVFFGIRIDQWINNREEKEKLADLWKKTNTFLKRMKSDINNNDTSIYELSEYKIYWDSLQRADNIATRLLQDDDKYIEISYVFSFLTFYKNSWSKHNSISEWKNNAKGLETSRIQKWIDSFDELISYTDENSHK